MIIYKDLVSGDELFSDAFKMGTCNDGIIVTCSGKLTSRSSDAVQLDGANPSAEEEAESEETSAQSGIDICLNHNLEEVTDFFDSKKSLQSYLKKWAKNLQSKKNKEELEDLKANGASSMKAFVDLYDPKECTVYAGCNFDLTENKHSLAIGVWGEDGTSVVLHCLKMALEEEKC